MSLQIIYIQYCIWFCLVWFYGPFCWLFNARSLFMFFFKQFILAEVLFIVYTQLNVKTVLFQTIEFAISTLFKSQK